jgi:hypothetical protein
MLRREFIAGLGSADEQKTFPLWHAREIAATFKREVPERL